MRLALRQIAESLIDDERAGERGCVRRTPLGMTEVVMRRILGSERWSLFSGY
ncbi:MAG TPA: hypothetical protein VN776_13690 [Terracidiphilus sp.]|nr:hypothetical protein [Terracidiphilus sp.]